MCEGGAAGLGWCAHHAEGPQVGRRRVRLVLELFGRPETARALAPRHAAAGDVAAEPEVAEARAPRGVEQDVLVLEVAVHDAGAVEHLEREDDGAEEELEVRVRERAAPAREVVREGASTHQLERQDNVALVAVREVGLDQEWCAQARRDPVLEQDAGLDVALGQHLQGLALESVLATRHSVDRKVASAEAAFREQSVRVEVGLGDAKFVGAGGGCARIGGH